MVYPVSNMHKQCSIAEVLKSQFTKESNKEGRTNSFRNLKKFFIIVLVTFETISGDGEKKSGIFVLHSEFKKIKNRRTSAPRLWPRKPFSLMAFFLFQWVKIMIAVYWLVSSRGQRVQILAADKFLSIDTCRCGFFLLVNYSYNKPQQKHLLRLIMGLNNFGKINCEKMALRTTPTIWEELFLVFHSPGGSFFHRARVSSLTYKAKVNLTYLSLTWIVILFINH